MKRSLTSLIAAAVVAAWAGISQAAMLTGTYTALPASNSGASAFVNFADQGTADWAIWNSSSYSSGAPTAAKVGSDIIGDAYAIGGSGSLRSAKGTDIDYSTTPGQTPSSKFSYAILNSQLATTGAGVGVDITAPTLETYTAWVYVGGFDTITNTLTATLAGATPVAFTPTFGAGDGTYKDAGIFELHFTPDSLNNGDNVLHVSMVLHQTGTNTHVLLQGAAVAVPEPATLGLLALGGLALTIKRHRRA